MTHDSHAADAGSGPAKLRVAVVGAGSFGALHARSVAAHPGADLAAIVDLSPDRSRAVRDALGPSGASAMVASDLASVFAETSVDAVSIVVGGDQRVALALQAMDAGCSVLIEKPVALSVADAETLADRADRCGVTALPAHILRFAPPYREVRDRIRQGEIGRPVSMCFRRHRGTDHQERFPDVHPVLMTMIHDIDLALWFAGTALVAQRPVEVIAATARRVPDGPQPVDVRARVLLPGGIDCSFEASWALEQDEVISDALVVQGEDGTIRLDLGDLVSAGIAGIDRESTWLTPADGGGALGEEVAEFLRLARDPRSERTVTMDDAVAGLRVAEAIVRAATEAEVVEESPRRGGA